MICSLHYLKEYFADRTRLACVILQKNLLLFLQFYKKKIILIDHVILYNAEYECQTENIVINMNEFIQSER